MLFAMKASPVAMNEINAWLDSEQDYTSGVNLFVIHGKNPTLKRLFPGKEYKYKNKLVYELTKLTGQPFTPIPVKADRILKPSSLSPQLLPEDIGALGDNLPKVIARLIKEYGKRYNDRSIAHHALKEIPPDNRPENVVARQKLLMTISEHSSRMDELYLSKQAFEKEGTLPDEETHFPKKNVKHFPSELSVEDIKKQIRNNEQSLSKDMLLLEFQCKTRLPAPNPMPAGPKRAEIQKRITSKRDLIAKLKIQLDGINSNLGG